MLWRYGATAKVDPSFKRLHKVLLKLVAAVRRLRPACPLAEVLADGLKDIEHHRALGAGDG